MGSVSLQWCVVLSVDIVSIFTNIFPLSLVCVMLGSLAINCFLSKYIYIHGSFYHLIIFNTVCIIMCRRHHQLNHGFLVRYVVTHFVLLMCF